MRPGKGARLLPRFDVWQVNSDAEYHEAGEVRDSARELPKSLSKP